MEQGYTRSVSAQATDYYPFGRSFENVNVAKNRYLYNGKELQDQLVGGTPFGWYDYGARFYDPEIARWHSVDPLCELSRKWSTYNYAYNNPIKLTDPDGMHPADVNGDDFRNEKFSNSGNEIPLWLQHGRENGGNVDDPLSRIRGIMAMYDPKGEDPFIPNGSFYERFIDRGVCMISKTSGSKENDPKKVKTPVKQSNKTKNSYVISIANGAIAFGPGLMFDFGTVLEHNGKACIYFTAGYIFLGGGVSFLGGYSISKGGMENVGGKSSGVLIRVTIKYLKASSISYSQEGENTQILGFSGGNGALYGAYRAYTFVSPAPDSDFWCRPGRK